MKFFRGVEAQKYKVNVEIASLLKIFVKIVSRIRRTLKFWNPRHNSFEACASRDRVVDPPPNSAAHDLREGTRSSRHSRLFTFSQRRGATLRICVCVSRP